ncbi:Oidioi.mRNA.OKI2018_I69.chr2.g4991.t1.cds [Oikopleura dioica]|uniref:Hexosyltransferase n=1 Tax=Oikopleura dioica TaxID=34765 RepID=A0ABN7T4M8_OIKDI|nr:Oidioi.mRNA.OKI2018_I69.chr2.g4991.t1.cds [Oikopleura dioica]
MIKRSIFVEFLTALAIGYVVGQILSFTLLKDATCDASRLPVIGEEVKNSSASGAGSNSKSDHVKQKVHKRPKRRIFIAIHSTPEYLKTRGQAIKDSWLQEIDERIATVRFISAPLEGFPTFTLPDVNDYDYPPQKKSFKLLAYFASIADKYDWFIRVDDDLHMQFDHLIKFLSKLDPDEPHYIGGTGFGRDADDYIPHGTAFCMGGSGVLFSHALITKLRPYLTTCIKNLMTEHEDVEVGRCIWTHLNIDCTKSYETNELLHQNWKSHVAAGEIGYKNDIDAELDLDEKVLHSSITLHAIKNPVSQIRVRMRILRHRAKQLYGRTQSIREHMRDLGSIRIKSNFERKSLDGCIWSFIHNLETRWTVTDFTLGPIPHFQVHKPWLGMLNNIHEEYKHMLLSHQLYQCINSDRIAFLRSRSYKNQWEPQLFSRKFSDSVFVHEQMLLHDLVRQDPRTVTFIVPLFGRLDNFKRFAGVYGQILETDQNVNLIVSLSGEESERDDITHILRDTVGAENMVDKTMVVFCDIPFRKANCLQNAINELGDDDLFFVYDVDLVVDVEFIERIRNIAQSHVYFPVITSQYEIAKEKEPKISGNDGFWREWGVGPVAMTKQLYNQTAGYNQTISGWGNEDTELYESVIERRLPFIRARDEGIFHPWHDKNCHGLSKETGQYRACVNVKKDHVMGIMDLAKRYLKNESTLSFLELDE